MGTPFKLIADPFIKKTTQKKKTSYREVNAGTGVTFSNADDPGVLV